MKRVQEKVDLKKIIIDTIARLNHSRADREDGKRNNFKKRDEVRAAGAIMNAFRDGARLTDDKKLSLSTINRYLSKIRAAIESTGYKHHTLDRKLKSIAKKYPELADHAEKLQGIGFGEASRYRKKLVAELSREARTDRRKGVDVAKQLKAIDDLKNLEIVPVIIRELELDDIDKGELADKAEKKLSHKKSHQMKINAEKITGMIVDLMTDRSRLHSHDDDQNTRKNILMSYPELSEKEADQKLAEYIHNRQAIDLSIAVALATGRRAIEVMVQGSFKRKGKNLLEFTGQAKDRGRTGSYEIPCLVDADLIIKSVERIRSSIYAQHLKSVMTECVKYSKNDRFNHASRHLNTVARRTFKKYLGDKTWGEWNYKDSRAIYARLAYTAHYNHAIKNSLPMIDDGDFFTKILGHADSVAKEHYKAFYVDDDFSYVEQRDIQTRPNKRTAEIKTDGADRLAITKNLAEHKLVKGNVKMERLAVKLHPFVLAHPDVVITKKWLRMSIKGKTENHADFIAILEKIGIIEP